MLDHGDIAGGGQRFALRLASELRGRGLTTRVGCRRGSPLDDWCDQAGIKTIDVRYPGARPVAAPLGRSGGDSNAALLRGLGRDTVVVANHPRVQAYLFAASRGLRGSTPVVNLVHEQDSARRISARLAYRRFGAMMVIGANAAGEYRRRLPGVPVAKVNNFLPAEYFREAAARRRNSPPDRRPVLGVLARMIPEKGIAELVEEVAVETTRPLWGELLIGAASRGSRLHRRGRAADRRFGARRSRPATRGSRGRPTVSRLDRPARGALDRQ